MKKLLKYLKSPTKHYRVMMLDDDQILTTTMKRKLEKELPEKMKGYTFEFEVFNNPNVDFPQTLEAAPPDFLLLDFHIDLGGGKEVLGINVLKKVLKEHPDVTVIMLTSEDKLDIAIDLMREGAYDFVLKSESAVVNIVKAMGRRIAYARMEFTSQRNKVLLQALTVIYLISMLVLVGMGVIFPAP